MDKKCKCCGEIKPTTDFYFHRGNCKDCYNKKSLEKYNDNKEKFNLDGKTWRRTNPKRVWAHNVIRTHIKCGFIVNITTDELINFIKDQTHCNICGKELHFSVGDKDGKSNIDSPTIDRIDNEQEMNLNNIQLVCMNCNRRKGADTMEDFIEYCIMISHKFGR